jgi:hypothetical protein
MLGSALALSLYVVVGLAATGVWETKPFTEWTDKEIQVVLTDSPWAGKGNLTHARAGGSVGPVPDWKITVAWRTALPIRQALIRQQIGLGGKVMQDHQAILSAVDERYIIAVEGLPGMYAGMIEAIGAQTMLERDGKSPIMATQGVAQLFDKNGKSMEQLPARGGRPGASGGGRAGGAGVGDGSTATLIFGFPKSDPITAADKDVEFTSTIGTYHLKHKFRLKDMLLSGEPSL